MSPSACEVEAGCGDDDVGLQQLAGFQQDAVLDEAVDLVGDDGGLAARDRLEQIGIGHEGDALPPRPVARREMLSRRRTPGPSTALICADQFLLHLLPAR